MASQLTEIVSLRFGPGKISPLEYFDLGLFDDVTYSRAAKREFIGRTCNREVDAQLNQRQWRAVADSKIVLTATLQGLGFTTPHTYAAYRPEGRSVPNLRFLRTPDELADYVRHGMPYPVFAKPVRSHHGEGAFRLLDYDSTNDQLLLSADGDRCTVTEFVEQVIRFPNTPRFGYIFQQPIAQHPDMVRLSGSTVSTMRMVVALDDGGPRLVRTMFRVARAAAVTDNLVGGTTSSIAAPINIETGAIIKAVSGIGLLAAQVETHPDTGVPLPGFTIPHWHACVETVLDAASLFPGLQLQHWDVAVGAEGPVLIELNYAGGVTLSQPISRRGILTPEFLDFVARRGDPSAKP